MLVWLSVWSEVQLVCVWSSRCQYIQKPHRPLPHLNPDWFYLFGTGLSRSSWVRRGGYAGVIKQTNVQWVLKAPANARRYTSAVLAIPLCPSIRLSQSSKKGKGSPYSITERRVPELFPVLGSQPADDWVVNPAVGCHYFPPGPQLPSRPLRRLLPVSLLGKQRHDGCEQLA